MSETKTIEYITLPPEDNTQLNSSTTYEIADRTWRKSAAHSIEYSDIIRWNHGTGSGGSSISDIIAPKLLLLAILSFRNDEAIKLAGATTLTPTGYYYEIISQKLNANGQIANEPVRKVVFAPSVLENDYELYFVADDNFQKIYKKNNDIQTELTYSSVFNFLPGHLYKISGSTLKDCSNTDISYTNGIHEVNITNLS